jgi:peroxin-14
MFGMYLDIQKGKILEDLSEEEVKGRWKSFVGKW